jgi:hypothetical protein
LGYPGTVPDPKQAGQRPRSSAGVASVIGPPGEPRRRRASGPRSRPRPAAAHGITRRNAPTCGRPDGRTERRTPPLRCPADHCSAIRLTPPSSDAADTRNQASDFGHLHRGSPHPRSAPGRALRGQDSGVPDVSPAPARTRIPNTGSQWGFAAGTMGGCAGSCRHDVPSCRQNRGAAAPGRAPFMPIKYGLTVSGSRPARSSEGR